MTRRVEERITAAMSPRTVEQLRGIAEITGAGLSDLLRIGALRLLEDWNGAVRDPQRTARLFVEIAEYKRRGWDPRELVANEGEPPIADVEK